MNENSFINKNNPYISFNSIPNYARFRSILHANVWPRNTVVLESIHRDDVPFQGISSSKLTFWHLKLAFLHVCIISDGVG